MPCGEPVVTRERVVDAVGRRSQVRRQALCRNHADQDGLATREVYLAKKAAMERLISEHREVYERYLVEELEAAVARRTT
jgi:hypothetical protein